jgi:hypothetical protein
MSNIIRFPAGRPVPAERIPREQFQPLAGLALDVVDQILVLLDQADHDGERSLAAPIGALSQIVWCAGADRDLEGG